ncbi:MAG: GlsB/YeaQ/YmgE family stress response membrane protein [Ilumatobacteraceae bacterium]
MNIFAWIITGLIAGLLARWIVRDDRSGCLYTIAVGVIGALIGGALMNAAGSKGVNDFDLRSILIAALGAVLLLLVLEAIGGRRRSIGGRRRRR